MKDSFIKKIVTISELESLSKDLSELFKEDNEKYGHILNLKHDYELMTKSFSHESLLIWNTHVWGHFNGEKWDAIFASIIRKSEKFNKKIMDEYLWLSKNSNSGMKLYMTAVNFAKKQNCEFMSMNVVENHPYSNKLKTVYTKLGFQKDHETYIKKL